jgi:hypothetical protein
MWTFKLTLVVIISWGSGVMFMSIVEEKDNLINGSIVGHNVGHMPYVIVISLWVAYSFPYAFFIELSTH